MRQRISEEIFVDCFLGLVTKELEIIKGRIWAGERDTYLDLARGG
jgi:hypothetical protein